ncbi:MAG: TIGR02206 family membrane protein [Flavobacteriales bacterium]|nr:TIGR02206 family membrane protein [Flavobacteriales bacterium]
MMEHKIIPPFSNEWYIYNLITIFVIVGIIFFSKSISSTHKNRLSLIIAGLFICEFLFMDIYHIYTGLWSMQDSMPLHLCSIMWFVCIYLFLTHKQWAFEMILFIGMPGGIHSLLTPELTHGDSFLHKIDFFVGHGGLVLAPFYAIFVMKMWPRKNAWWKSFLKLQILVLIVGIINYLLGSNYMYLAYPPIANNPLIPSAESFFGQWPYYILIFELAVLMHAIIINIPFLLKSENKK